MAKMNRCSGNCLKLSDVHMTKCDGEDKCEPGWGDCDNDIANGCETPLNSTVEHCGVCGHSCTEVETNAYNVACIESACVIISCNPPFGNCDDNVAGCETTLNNTLEHCGACGNQCRNKHICSNSVCCLDNDIDTTSLPSKCCTTGAHIWTKTIIHGWGDYEYIYRCTSKNLDYFFSPWERLD